MKPLVLFPTCKKCRFGPKSLSDLPCSHPRCLESLKLELPFPLGCHFDVSNNPTRALKFPEIDPLNPYIPLITSNLKDGISTWSSPPSRKDQVKTEAKALVKEVLTEIMNEGVGAQDLIANLADIRGGLIKEIEKARNAPEETFSSYNEGWGDALESVLKALDKKLKNLT